MQIDLLFLELLCMGICVWMYLYVFIVTSNPQIIIILIPKGLRKRGANTHTHTTHFMLIFGKWLILQRQHCGMTKKPNRIFHLIRISMDCSYVLAAQEGAFHFLFYCFFFAFFHHTQPSLVGCIFGTLFSNIMLLIQFTDTKWSTR